MTVRFVPLVAMLLMIIPKLGPHAQPVDTNHLQSFSKTDFYKSLVARAIASVPPIVFQRCPALISNSSTTTTVKPVSFGVDGYPDAGLWKQSFPVSGCGNDTILNFYFSAGSDEKVTTIIGLPGATHADITLQRDAYTYANTGASLAAKDCKSFTVKSTRFEGYGLVNPPIPDPGTNNHSRPWWETWTMAGCSRTIDVPVDFVPDKNGTRIIQPGGATER